MCLVPAEGRAHGRGHSLIVWAVLPFGRRENSIENRPGPQLGANPVPAGVKPRGPNSPLPCVPSSWAVQPQRGMDGFATCFMRCHLFTKGVTEGSLAVCKGGPWASSGRLRCAVGLAPLGGCVDAPSRPLPEVLVPTQSLPVARTGRSAHLLMSRAECGGRCSQAQSRCLHGDSVDVQSHCRAGPHPFLSGLPRLQGTGTPRLSVQTAQAGQCPRQGAGRCPVTAASVLWRLGSPLVPRSDHRGADAVHAPPPRPWVTSGSPLCNCFCCLNLQIVLKPALRLRPRTQRRPVSSWLEPAGTK